ncbi:MAG: hypothetical protein A2Y62_07720 [Candidatus Fischerbacteria bacterium RBG_13_37_8]|uniref:Fibronectin type-III domain-containing protein n=1 Tax=Candidatus Fischerbacteria bacterium RBG_13_37_8 TaxID=1817863 RepID=A0A1F5V910_9BACT|nr:MAG: hypothetical protein A2Y62_07720 [Candidatus Fischerbacteria bacterium RBG_13_37_8]
MCVSRNADPPEPLCDCISPPCEGPYCSQYAFAPFIDESANDESADSQVNLSNSVSRNELFSDSASSVEEYQYNVFKDTERNSEEGNSILSYSSDLVRFKDDPYQTNPNQQLPVSLSNKLPPGDRYAVLLTQVILPNGLKIQYDYNEYGELSNISYPTDGEVEYEYGEYGYVGCIGIRKGKDLPYIDINEEDTREVVKKTVTNGNEKYIWEYDRQASIGPSEVSNPITTTIKDAENNYTKYFFYHEAMDPDNDNFKCMAEVSLVKMIDYKDANQNKMRTEEYFYVGDNSKYNNLRLERKITTFNDDSNKQVVVEYKYDDYYGQQVLECQQATIQGQEMTKMMHRSYEPYNIERWVINTFTESGLYTAYSKTCSLSGLEPDALTTYCYYGQVCASGEPVTNNRFGQIYSEQRYAYPKTGSSSDDVFIVYDYDGNGIRVIKKLPDSTILYVHDQADNVIQEYYYSREGELDKVKDYIYFNGNLIATIDEDKTTPRIDTFEVPQYVSDNVITYAWTASEEESTLTARRAWLSEGTGDCSYQSPDKVPYLTLSPPMYVTPDEIVESLSDTLCQACQYRIAFEIMNEAKLISYRCSDVITVDKTAPELEYMHGPQGCWSHIDRVQFNWRGEDDVSGIKAYFAIGTGPGKTNVVNWTEFDATQFDNVVVTGFTLDAGSTYYLTIKLINGAGLVTISPSESFVTATNEFNSHFINASISKIVTTDSVVSITFKNYCSLQNWQFGYTKLSVILGRIVSSGARDNSAFSSGLTEGLEQYLVELEPGEIIEPDGEKTFTFSLPEEWTTWSRVLNLSFAMYDTRDPNLLFGDVEHRMVLASPYEKTISWNKVKPYDYLNVYYKSTRADVDIGEMTLRRKSVILCCCAG